MNSAHEISSVQNSISTRRAIIVVGIADERFGEGQTTVGVSFDQFSLDRHQITGNCFRYTRLRAEAPAEEGEVRYFVFDAPPGHYVLSPFTARRVDESARAAVHAPPGVASYFGDFVDAGEGEQRMTVRRASFAAADMFASELGLSELKLAEITPVENFGPIFLCTP